jgi:hypothetical protein
VLSFKINLRLVILLTLLISVLSGCLSPRISQSDVSLSVTVNVDGGSKKINVASGSKIQQVLETAGLTLGSLDKVEPPVYTLVSDGLTVKVTRGREELETRQVVLPYKQLKIDNESIPEKSPPAMLVVGQPGKAETTIRHVYEDNVETRSYQFEPVILEPAVDQVMMYGRQSPFEPLNIPGKLVYISYGSAYLMENSTANRILLSTGTDQKGKVLNDLDGRVFHLSKDGTWLLYTRKSTKNVDVEINTLWALNIDNPKAKPIDLKTSNIVHFADWDPTTTSALRVLYSTVEPRAAPPGWQANNDLYRMVVGTNGNLGVREKIIEANTGGLYGWWGTDYFWSPNGKLLAYSRPDGIGIVSFKNKTLLPLMSIAPLQTRSDWALIPGLCWGADAQILYVVNHAPPSGLANPEESSNFNLNAISLESDANISIVQQSGMFSYPAASSSRQVGSQRSYFVAYLQALAPIQSGTSGYSLVIMDRDGSNRRTVFPNPGSVGLEPQTPVWAPEALFSNEGDYLAVIYRGDLWLIDAATGQSHQITSDGLFQKLIWE